MDARGVVPLETVPASRKLGREAARDLVRAVKRVVVTKGRKRSEHAGGSRAGEEVVESLLGPTGNLRAPTVRAGDTLLVGYDEEQYREVLE